MASALIGVLSATFVTATAAEGTGAVMNPAAVGAHYAIGVPVCAVPTPGHDRCMAVRRELVSAGTTGARRYAVRAGDIPLGPAGGYTPNDIAAAYGAKASVGGAGQTVAVVDAFNDPTISADLSVFDTKYALPAETPTSFRVVGQTGTTVLPANDTSGWSNEEALDVETVRGLCNLCDIVLVEANSDSSSDLSAGVAAASTLGATEISNSYGGPESDPDTTAPYNYPGIVVTASSGDDGWYDQDLLGSANSPEVPAAYPDVVAVGGTTLNISRDGARTDETVWNDNGVYDYNAQVANSPQGATGGGCSTLYSAQPWQLHVAGYASTGCGTSRLSADVSVDGDYLTGLDIYSGFDCGTACEPTGWNTYGGTSLSSALLAALWALAGGSHGLTYPAAALYATHPGSPAFYDVTEGGNGFCAGYGGCESLSMSPNSAGAGMLDCAWDKSGNEVTPTGQCVAGPGYDGPSGVGAPNGLNAFVPVNPTAAVTIPAKVKAKAKVHVSAATSTDPYPGGSLTTYSWSWGDGSSASTGVRATHTYAKAGTYHLTLTVTDGFGLSDHRTVKVHVKK